MFGSKQPFAAPNADGSSERQTAFDASPPYILEDGKQYSATMVTSHGTLEIDLYAEKAPTTVNNFVFLARYHYYDSLSFHRIISGFVIQGGDPVGNGTGGPGYRFRDELPKAGEYKIGTLAMANAGPNTNGSQFFIVSGPSGENLPPQYAIFGQVTSGLNVVADLDAKGTGSGRPTEACSMISVTIHES